MNGIEIECKNCGSSNIVKFGKYRYYLHLVDTFREPPNYQQSFVFINLPNPYML